MTRLYYTSFIILHFACGANDKPQNIEDNPDDSLRKVDSLELYNKQVELNPSNPAALYQRSQYFIRNGKVGEAQLDLESAMAIDSSNLKVRSSYANILLARLDLDNSKYHYEFVLKQDSTNIAALMGMSRIFAFLKNNGQAMFYLDLLLHEDPHYADAYFLKGMIYRADYYETKREESWNRALSSYQTAVEQDPDYYAAYIEMGVMYDQQGDDIALDYYRSALEIYSESIEAWYCIGMYYQNRGNVDSAFISYRKLNEIDSTYADAYYNQGYLHMMFTQKIDSAIFFFDEAVSLDPGYFQALNNLGLCYEKLGNVTTAIGYYQKAVKVNPDFKLAKDNLARLNK